MTVKAIYIHHEKMKKMKMKKYLLIVILTWMGIFTQAQVTVKLGSVENAVPGTYINIPLVVSGLSVTGQSFVGVEIKFSFQDNIMTFDSLAEGNPETPVSQWFAGCQNGVVSANWLEPNISPVNVEDNSTLVEFVFLYTGGQTDLIINQSATIIYDMNTNEIPVSQFINGEVTQAQGSESSVWEGTEDWSSVMNWSNGIPGDSTNAVISTGTVSLSSGGVCRNLTINAGSKIIIQPGKSLTVNGSFSNSGEILIESDSLIQGSLIVKGTITQTGTSEMAFNIYQGATYLLTSPVQGETAGLFDGAGTTSTYLENTASWSPLASSSSLDPARGFELVSSAQKTILYNGQFNSTETTVNLSFTNQTDLSQAGWNLVGNPYSSSFDADNFLTRANTDKAIYAWDGNVYRVWNGTAGSIPGGIIPPGTGFFVRSSATGASLTFETEGKTHDFTHFGANYTPATNVLEVTLENFEDNSKKDEAYIQVENASSFNYDGDYDAFKLSNAANIPEVYFTGEDGYKLAIAAIPEATEAKLGIKVPVDGTYMISANTSNFLPDHPVYLIDQVAGLTKDLRTEDYVFLANAGDYTDRFRIILTGLGINDPGKDAGLNAFMSRGQINIFSNTVSGMATIRLFDLTGRLCYVSGVMLDKGSEVTISPVNGINLLSVETEGRVFHFKLLSPVMNQ
jgi:hypothetical protein